MSNAATYANAAKMNKPHRYAGAIEWIVTNTWPATADPVEVATDIRRRLTAASATPDEIETGVKHAIETHHRQTQTYLNAGGR